ncbi:MULTISPECIES: hypothetical protein [Gimesia]|nr:MULTISPECIES: hypothetical protein [Gimesia]
MTWIILLGLWPLSWACWIWRQRLDSNMESCKKQIVQLAVIILLGVYVLNLGYGFEGSFKPIEDYTFVSRTLAGNESVVDENGGGNRFTGSWMGKIPVPFPKNYLRGIDLQKVDFELKKWSYLNGEWKKGGGYYYLYALMMKVPLGTWGLFLLAMGLTFFNRHYRSSWRNELVLLLPAATIFLFVSSQTGFSRYLRYVLPSFPFLFIFISKVAQSIKFRQWIISIPMSAALLWSVGSSLFVYPHSMSYFNEIAGAPREVTGILLTLTSTGDRSCCI